MQSEPHHVGEILNSLEALAGKQERVAIGEALERFGHRSYGPILLVIPLIDISPIGAIPGLPTFMALILALTGLQMVIGREHIWLPGFIARRSVSSGRLCKATARLRPIAQRLDRWFHGRLRAITHGPFVRLAGVAVLLLCALIPPLEVVPLATTAPMAAIGAIGLALLVRDGVLMLVALALAVGAVALGAQLMLGRGG